MILFSIVTEPVFIGLENKIIIRADLLRPIVQAVFI